jgi:secondary thiamine-phosphate synthase enzyme
MTLVRQESLIVRTRPRAFEEVGSRIDAVVRAANVTTGSCQVFLRHTSASLLICENADPAVRRDLERFMNRVAPEGADYEHDAEGPDDMPAHIRSMLAGVSLSVPVLEGRLGLGTWQGIYLWEHRARAHARELIVTVQGI